MCVCITVVDPDEYIYNVTIGVGGGAYDNQFLSWDKEGTLDDRGYSGNLTLMKEYQVLALLLADDGC